MTLDEAIKSEEIIVDACESTASTCDLSDRYERNVAFENGKCTEEHKQIAEWLKELKRLKEQEQCEDCVSRKTAKEKAWNLCLETGYDNEKVVEMLDDLPSVRPTPKKGRWIGHREHCENLGMMPNGLGVFEWCSNCDCAIDIREYQRNHYNYCPNCGAKMEVEQE